MTVTALLLIIFPALMIWCAASDFLTMKITNRLVLLVLASYVVVAPIAGIPFGTMLWSFGIAFAVLVVTFTLFQLGVIGGGDAKMCPAIMLWVGPTLGLEFAIMFSLLGGVLTIVLLLVRRAPPMPIIGGQDWYVRLTHPKSGIPYGIAFAAGALLVYPETAIFKGLV